MPAGLLYLLEDGDGIPPSGSFTTDTSPTLGWGASGGTAFSVRITSGSQFIVSGNVSDTQFTLPLTLSIGGYQAYLTIFGSTGGVLSSASGTFQILAWLRPARVYSTTDIFPASLPDPTYIRYLPQWMPVQRGSNGGAASGSLLYKFFLPTLKYLSQINLDEESVISQTSVISSPVGLPRLWWHVFTPLSPRDTITASVSASGTSGDIRQVTTFHEFVTADDAVFLVGDTGNIGFRNLALRTVTVSPVGTSGTLATQYWMPGEGQGIIPDTDVLFTFPTSGILYRIPAGSPAIDPYRAVIQLTSPFSGDIVFTYHSQTFSSILQVSISGGIRTSPVSSDLWNRFDELGVLAGIVRKPGEDNLSMKRRLYSRFISSIGTDFISTAQHVSQDLLLTEVIPWDGRATLDFTPSGYYGIRRIDVLGVPELGTVSEILTPGLGWETTGAFQFFGSKTDWLKGWLVTIDGMVADSLNHPGMIATGNVLFFPTSGPAISGIVRAAYQYRNYTPVLDTLAFVTQVVPSSGNLPSGDYRVLITRNVRVFTVSDPNYRRDFLLSPDGTPNGDFLHLKDLLLETSNIHVGRARWGKAYWAPQSEITSPTEHLPVVLDISSITECSETSNFL